MCVILQNTRIEFEAISSYLAYISVCYAFMLSSFVNMYQ